MNLLTSTTGFTESFMKGTGIATDTTGEQTHITLHFFPDVFSERHGKAWKVSN